MPGGLPRVRMSGRRASCICSGCRRPVAEVDGADGGAARIDHQRLKHFITSSTLGYAAM
jgi:hypothetical protein